MGGRGRGRGGGGRGGIFASGSSLMGGFTYQELKEVAMKQTALYPDIELPETDEPTRKEKRNSNLQAKFETEAQQWMYRLPEPSSSALQVLQDQTDHRKTFAAPENAAKLGKEFFPANIWDPIFEKQKLKDRVKDGQSRKRRRLNLEQLVEDVDEQAENLDDEEGEEDDAAPSESESEEDLDYEQNYFDNGEGDDDGDAGGDDEGGIME